MGASTAAAAQAVAAKPRSWFGSSTGAPEYGVEGQVPFYGVGNQAIGYTTVTLCKHAEVSNKFLHTYTHRGVRCTEGDK
jgi:hypothetical protein